MIKFENYEVVGWEAAIRGMRNPMNSWKKGDSGWFASGPSDEDIPVDIDRGGYYELIIGPNDQDLMKRLRNAGTDHRKFMRMIAVYVDITAPLYWWKEFDTYKVGTVANSCSTMHKIAVKEFTRDDFSWDHLIGNRKVCRNEDIMAGPDCDDAPLDVLDAVIDALNIYRQKYVEIKGKKYWWQMIQLLPGSYNQRRTVMLNYEVLANIYKSRKNHKLDEWRDLCKWIESLPFSELITGEPDKKE